ncbi:hypothetical protein EVAR_98099_1 [Eumeta japonica]|uniref:Ig-like domain-containing protein n=1 Tax=Eumeta variegata TaxID=151549 RepID=A0A4C1XGN6_EUMVA|nr:hypothetical protein EVAR_98099_1 [Eumeta japonica]
MLFQTDSEDSPNFVYDRAHAENGNPTRSEVSARSQECTLFFSLSAPSFTPAALPGKSGGTRRSVSTLRVRRRVCEYAAVSGRGDVACSGRARRIGSKLCILEESQRDPPSYRHVSWIRKRDLHILTVGVHTYSSDARFAALHADGSDEWTLRVAPAQPRDSGAYECQVSTEPKISLSFRLTVVVAINNPVAYIRMAMFRHVIVTVSKAEILAGPELFVRAGSDINLTCIARHAPDPPRRKTQKESLSKSTGCISLDFAERSRQGYLLTGYFLALLCRLVFDSILGHVVSAF